MVKGGRRLRRSDAQAVAVGGPKKLAGDLGCVSASGRGTETKSGHGMTRLRLLHTTIAQSLFLIDLSLVAVFWPIAWWFARNEAVTADIRGIVLPAGGFVIALRDGPVPARSVCGQHHSATRVPMVVGMGVIAALLFQGIALVVGCLPRFRPTLARRRGGHRPGVPLLHALRTAGPGCAGRLAQAAVTATPVIGRRRRYDGSLDELDAFVADVVRRLTS